MTAGLFCLECEECPSGGHITISENVEDPFYGGGIHDDTCLSGDCLTVHGICGGENPDFDLDEALLQAKELQRALLENDAKAIVTLLNADQSVVRWVESRESLQLVNCSGKPVASFPVVEQVFLAAMGF